MRSLSPFREVYLFSRNAHSAGPRNMKFQQFFKVHQLSSNLQNILESSSETCMWNLSLFREVKCFHRKMLTLPAQEISWNFNIFSKFTNFHQTCRKYWNHHQKHHQTCRTYWNHHQKHACEIWAYSEKSNFFHRKRLTVVALEISWNFNIFFKIHLISSNMQNILESSSETCMWNLSLFRDVKFFHRKRLKSVGTKNMKFHHFCQNSPYFIKLAEHIGIIIRNMQVKFQPIQRSSIFSKKNADSTGPRNIIFQHFFKVHQISSNLQNLLESSSETCMWNLSPFREVNLFQGKMLTVPALWNMKFQHFFSKFT